MLIDIVNNIEENLTFFGHTWYLSPIRRNFRCLYMTHVEKSEITPYVEKFQVSPKHRCGEIWNLSYFVGIYSVYREICFVIIYMLWCVENWVKLCLWRKVTNIRYDFGYVHNIDKYCAVYTIYCIEIVHKWGWGGLAQYYSSYWAGWPQGNSAPLALSQNIHFQHLQTSSKTFSKTCTTFPKTNLFFSDFEENELSVL